MLSALLTLCEENPPVTDQWIPQKRQVMLTFVVTFLLVSGGRLNKKDGLTRYGDSHVKDKKS